MVATNFTREERLLQIEELENKIDKGKESTNEIFLVAKLHGLEVKHARKDEMNQYLQSYDNCFNTGMRVP